MSPAQLGGCISAQGAGGQALLQGDKESSSSQYHPTFSTRRRLKHVLLPVLIVGVYLLHTLNSVYWRLLDVHNKPPLRFLDCFQVHKPVVPSQGSHSDGEFSEKLLMDHVFAFSYGTPFVGHYVPPDSDFNHVTINLTVTSAGRQFDRLALMYLGDIEVFRTSTAEPTVNGIIWTYVKDVSQFKTLWKSPQTIIFDLGNLVYGQYNGTFNTTLTAVFSNVTDAAPAADLILPISAQRSSDNQSSAFITPPDVASVIQKVPLNASRAIVSIAACGQSTEEFWYSNALSSDTGTFSNTTGELYGFSPFREIQLLIDGSLVGVVWPFPIIFTGGIAPGFWRPIVGIDAFDLRESEIDITPFLPVLQLGYPHTFEIRVVGITEDGNGGFTVSEGVGSYWVVTGKIFVFYEDPAAATTATTSRDSSTSQESLIEAAPKPVWPILYPQPSPFPPTIRVHAPSPSFSITTSTSQNALGSNETLSYSIIAQRSLTTYSTTASWTQSLSYTSTNLISARGLTQLTSQSITGTSTSTINGISSSIAYSYPLSIHSSFTIFPNDTGFAISASLIRGLDLSSHIPDGDGEGRQALFPLPLSAGQRSALSTTQFGSAEYVAVRHEGKGGMKSFSRGDTTQNFNQGGYQRHVRAVNGRVVDDEEVGGCHGYGHGDGVAQTGGVYREKWGDAGAQMDEGGDSGGGRGSVRAMLGRGPGLA